jgi:hypothetical protein
MRKLVGIRGGAIVRPFHSVVRLFVFALLCSTLFLPKPAAGQISVTSSLNVWGNTLTGFCTTAPTFSVGYDPTVGTYIGPDVLYPYNTGTPPSNAGAEYAYQYYAYSETCKMTTPSGVQECPGDGSLQTAVPDPTYGYFPGCTWSVPVQPGYTYTITAVRIFFGEIS